MRVVALVQARMGSTRFPGKVLADIEGKPMLEHIVTRLRRAATLDEIVVVTTEKAEDDPVTAVAEGAGVQTFRGSELDVLKRYADAARALGAEVVVRITGDCPLIDPDVTDSVVRLLTEDPVGYDYTCNFLPRTFPQGLDAEAMTAETLARAGSLATTPSSREHVTPFIYEERPELFKIGCVSSGADESSRRWVVDTSEDLAYIRSLYAALDISNRDVRYGEILEAVRGAGNRL